MAEVGQVNCSSLFVGSSFVRLDPFFASREVEDPVGVVLQALEQNYARNWSSVYTAEKHLAGTNYGLVDFTRKKFKEYGAKASVDTYKVLLSYPESHALKLLDKNGDIEYTAPLKEDEFEEDPTSVGNDTVPTFLGFAANGNVTAEYVYVNYASKKDFEWLKENGIEVEGKIAVARYGGLNRGLKVKFAQDYGAVGVLIYTDPGDDGDITSANGYKQYPKGPARAESSVQRGSVMFLGGEGATPGDPTTPGYASKGDVERHDPHHSIGTIPALPVSYRDIKPILLKLNGHGEKTPKEWKGGFDGIDYTTGPNSKAKLNLYNNQTYKITPIWNVYGEFEGESKDEAILIGNHRDAWIKGGAGDPNSGSTVLVEIARALGELQDKGYKFKRSIILHSWDGEEYGLIGSTEYGEYAAKRLQKDVVAYINTDVAVQGSYLSLSASPVLNRVLRKVASWVPYPGGKEGSLHDHFIKEKGDIIRNLGSGSDYTVFLEHLGIPSADISFRPAKNDSIYHYHSNYDSFHWMDNFGDKGFVFHNVMAKYLSLLVLELSKHKVIEFSLNDYAKDLLFYFGLAEDAVPESWLDRDVPSSAVSKYVLIDKTNNHVVQKAAQSYYYDNSIFAFTELLQPYQCKHMRTMLMMDASHHKILKFGDVLRHTREQLENLEKKSLLFDAESAALQKRYDDRANLHWWEKIRLYFDIKHQNNLIQYFERNFLYEEGLDKRPWFKHIVFAAGRFTGYAGQTWPGIREAIEDENLENTVKWLGIAAQTAKRVSSGLDKVSGK
ncbi:hypothetical protein CXQ85_005378 [Candidozyma haemuli]|uniref:Uncharacterized protein n=1 Tax=Candidozyma haemuli TaxID=45357 RepID=A0A2V1AW71_9ASCO|nr:hypothetical protein CXQ85_005378 [[Candida] haemuloni]PVH22350.1 hypothetical protein CXQ85_005378 [[Candida] haemuloni]